jgi:adenylate kinase
VVRERLQVYRQSTEPLIEHYRKAGLLRTIDGDRSIEEVAESLRAVFSLASASGRRDSEGS